MEGNYSLYDRDSPALSGFELELYDAVSRDEPWELVETFADLRRLSPSADERAAAEYITDRFDEYGVPWERYDPEFWLSVPEEASVRVLHREGLEFYGSEERFDEERPPVKALAFSGSETVTAEAVHVEMPETEDTADALEKLSVDQLDADVEDKIVVVEGMFAAKQFFQDLEAAGAVGLVSIHPHDEEPQVTTATPIWGAIPHPDEQDRIPEMVNVTVSRSVGDQLLEEIEAGDDPVELEVSATVPRSWHECPLVVAHIPGEADPDNDDFILLHGHLDSWYYGVTDNATGNAGMVECARILNNHRDELRRDLWIAFWPAHEGGRYGGSTWFVDEFALELEANCLAHVNFDSPGVKDATEFNMTMWHAEGHDLCRTVIDEVTGKEPIEQRPPRAGDYAFYNLGLSGMMILSSGIPEEIKAERGFYPVGGSGGNSEAWHHTTDTLDKADPDVLRRDTQVYLIILSRLLRSSIVPLDFRRTVTNHLDIVAEYDEAAGDHFDLRPLRDELAALADRVDAFYEAKDRGAVDPETANEAIRQLSRWLVPVNFAERGRFQQDPATYRPPYPNLAPITDLPAQSGDEYRFNRTHLKRARNDAVYRIRQARQALPPES